VLGNFSSKVGLVTVCILVVAIMLDTTVIKLYGFLNIEIFSTSNTLRNNALFIALTILITAGQLVILEFVKRRIELIKIPRHLLFKIIQRIVSITQYAFIILLTFVILQIVWTSSYDVSILIISSSLSYSLAIIVMVFLIVLFILWLKAVANLVVFIYSISIVSLILNVGFTLFYVLDLLRNLPQSIEPHILHSFPIATFPLVGSAYVVISIISFGLTWTATAVLMRNYSKKLGKSKYWFIVSLPLVYFLLQFEPVVLNIFSSYQISEPVEFGVIYTILFTSSKPIGGMLFGIAFWNIARNLGGGPLKDYLIIAAYGFILFFSSNQAILLVDYNFPPFGLPTITLVGTSSYLIFIGIFCSALSISQDSKLRESIRKLAADEWSLLGGIGTAHMEREVLNRVLKITQRQKATMVTEMGVGASLSDDEIKHYLAEVIEEIKSKRSEQ
jgi:hypothetical protein